MECFEDLRLKLDWSTQTLRKSRLLVKPKGVLSKGSQRESLEDGGMLITKAFGESY